MTIKELEIRLAAARHLGAKNDSLVLFTPDSESGTAIPNMPKTVRAVDVRDSLETQGVVFIGRK